MKLLAALLFFHFKLELSGSLYNFNTQREAQLTLSKLCQKKTHIFNSCNLDVDDYFPTILCRFCYQGQT